jgi:WhiB family redox-sensing transcriptional regulator
VRIIRISRPDWFADALCLGTGPSTFFPDQGRNTLAARNTCARCPVVQQCLEHAIDDPSLMGVWGGTTENERDQIRRRRATR